MDFILSLNNVPVNTPKPTFQFIILFNAASPLCAIIYSDPSGNGIYICAIYVPVPSIFSITADVR